MAEADARVGALISKAIGDEFSEATDSKIFAVGEGDVNDAIFIHVMTS